MHLKIGFYITALYSQRKWKNPAHLNRNVVTSKPPAHVSALLKTAPTRNLKLNAKRFHKRNHPLLLLLHFSPPT